MSNKEPNVAGQEAKAGRESTASPVDAITTNAPVPATPSAAEVAEVALDLRARAGVYDEYGWHGEAELKAASMLAALHARNEALERVLRDYAAAYPFGRLGEQARAVLTAAKEEGWRP